MSKFLFRGFLTLLAGMPTVANAQCLPYSVAYTVQDTCACTGRTDYPGGCSGTTDPYDNCQVRSYYNCGINGSQTCQIAFTESVPKCGPSGNVILQGSQPAVKLSDQQKDTIKAFLAAGSLKQKNQCLASAEAFNAWLTHEINTRKSRTGVAP